VIDVVKKENEHLYVSCHLLWE